MLRDSKLVGLEKIATMRGVAENTVDSGRLHAYHHHGVYIGTYNRGDLSCSAMERRFRFYPKAELGAIPYIRWRFNQTGLDTDRVFEFLRMASSGGSRELTTGSERDLRGGRRCATIFENSTSHVEWLLRECGAICRESNHPSIPVQERSSGDRVWRGEGKQDTKGLNGEQRIVRFLHDYLTQGIKLYFNHL